MKGVVLKNQKTILSQILQIEQIISLDKFILTIIFPIHNSKKDSLDLLDLRGIKKTKDHEKINYSGNQGAI